MPDRLDQLFSNLDHWRHLPNYQLERRADIFFSLYLHGVLEKSLQVDLAPTIIPELPIRRDLIWPETPSRKSVKVDYVLAARDGSAVYFVELKTDAGSRRGAQDEYLRRARDVGFRRILEGIVEIWQATNAHAKYHHLAARLATLGFLRLPPDLESYIYPVRRGLVRKLAEVEVTASDPTIELIYIQPTATADDRCIDFDHFAAHVRTFDDPLSQAFGRHLDRWKHAAALSPPPTWG